MISNLASAGACSKAIVLFCALFVAMSIGSIVEVTRFYVFSFVEMHWSVNSMPRLSRFLLTLPSKDLYPRHNVYILLFGTSWAIMAIKSIDHHKSRLYAIISIWMILNVVFGLLLSLVLIYPCLPQLKVLAPELLSSSSSSDSITIMFYISIACLLAKICKNAFFEH